MGEDFLLQTKTAQLLYEEYAKQMPIIDYHCHLSPQQIAEDIKFENLTQGWLYGDHYKWIPFQTFSKKSESRGFNDYDFDQTNEYEDQFNQEKIYQRNSKVIGPKSTFSSGCKIKHALYGEGTVLDAEGAGPDEKVTIIFRDGVRKKFMVKFAPLERI